MDYHQDHHEHDYEAEIRRLEELKAQLIATQEHVRNMPLAEVEELAESIIDMEIGEQIDEVVCQVRDMRADQAPTADPGTPHPLDLPCERARDLDSWMRQPHKDPEEFRTEFDQHVGRTVESIDSAQHLIKAAGTLERVSDLNLEALDQVAQVDAAAAHTIIRRMIEMLQGAAREVRGLEPDRSSPER